MWKAMRSPNACKTCALGMGGQQGGMVNESGKFPEFCKKSVQAMAADMQGAITKEFFEKYTLSQLSAMSSRELEAVGRITFPLFAGPLDMHYKPISWQEAIAKVTIRFQRLTQVIHFTTALVARVTKLVFYCNLWHECEAQTTLTIALFTVTRRVELALLVLQVPERQP